jgi:S-disulfanyl-L-cysteine oxidoreductase SoxD
MLEKLLMKTRVAILGVVTMACTVSISSAHVKLPTPQPQAASSTEPQQSVWDGVYTAEQAKRGEILYAQTCVRCHGSDLNGGEIAPGLNNAEFKSNWSGLTVDDLLERIKVSMPQNDPGSLSRQQTADILAFVLSKNGFPRGTTELAREAEVLKAIRFEANKPEAAGVADTAQSLAGETLTYDHVHFGVPDQTKAVEWYAKYLGGQPGPVGEPNERLLFGKIRFIFQKTDKPLPSAGSTVDHIALSFSDLTAKMKEFEAEGIKIIMPITEEPGLYKHAFIEDPWGAKIEVLQDPETLGFHHVHLRAPDPQAAFNWYLDMFGGELTKLKGRVDAVKYGDVWILAEKGNATPSEGHAIDHLGWRTTTDLNAKVAELKAKGVKFTAEPRPVRDIHVSFVEGPAAVKIELLQR